MATINWRGPRSKPYVLVELTPQESEYAATSGLERYQSQRAANRRDGKSRAQDDGTALDRVGAIGECAVSKALNIPWDGRFKEIPEWHAWRIEGHDCSGIEVKSTTRTRGRLLIRGNEPLKPTTPYVLAIVEPTTYQRVLLIGWALGSEVMIPNNWKDESDGMPRPCWAHEQSALRGMRELTDTRGVIIQG